jgi:hypothetical protein
MEFCFFIGLTRPVRIYITAEATYCGTDYFDKKMPHSEQSESSIVYNNCPASIADQIRTLITLTTPPPPLRPDADDF